jgi:hypothetical protein
MYIYLSNSKCKLREQKGVFFHGPRTIHPDKLHLYFQFVVMKALILN